MYRALDCEYLEKSEFKTVYDFASECRKQIKGFRKYLRNYKKIIKRLRNFELRNCEFLNYYEFPNP